MVYKKYQISFNRIRHWGLKKVVLAGMSFLLALVLYFFCLPAKLFTESYSTVLLDSEGSLLSASISEDGQWRFPPDKSVPEKFKQAIVLVEDKRFYSHPGIDPFALFRAAKQNMTAGKVISGGSTLSMQVIRLSKKNSNRTFWNKCVESLQATRLEFRYTKEEILSLYAAHAPFGGNVVGLEAACWRYFGRQPDELSWSEAALLAVLPNNPSLINLSRNRETLRAKRDRLLVLLHQAAKLDDLSFELALSEPVPDRPIPLPRFAPHLLDRAVKDAKAETRILTTVKSALQQSVTNILHEHHVKLRGNQVFNAAALVIDVETGNVLTYVGNVGAGRDHHEDVDIIQARRSTGSILKPFLFAALLDEGMILPGTLMPDVPTMINGFSPKNFSRQYDGAVPADEALVRSLNIPAVHGLRQYRYEKFYGLLKNAGINSLIKPADHYGLSLILGGAEATLWEITGAYASMARTLNDYFDLPGMNRYNARAYHAPVYVRSPLEATPGGMAESHSVFSAAALWLTFETLKELYRPGEETGWRSFHSSKKIAWKTGTSFGLRDGWAVGVNPDFAVGVWVGNADGEGRPGLTGTETAAPILFDIFSRLPGQSWFGKPLSELTEVKVCRQSGARAAAFCDDTEKLWIGKRGLRSRSCPYHKKIHLTTNGKHRIHSGCENLNTIYSENWFILPPVLEHYYKAHHASYKSLPPFRKDCLDPSSIAAMELIYPKSESRIFVPRGLDGSIGNAIFQAAHRNPASVVYWHLDGQFVGVTTKAHRLPFAPSEGFHQITLVDEQGVTLQKSFQVLSQR